MHTSTQSSLQSSPLRSLAPPAQLSAPQTKRGGKPRIKKVRKAVTGSNHHTARDFRCAQRGLFVFWVGGICVRVVRGRGRWRALQDIKHSR